jgi:hypothetical protein
MKLDSVGLVFVCAIVFSSVAGAQERLQNPAAGIE